MTTIDNRADLGRVLDRLLNGKALAEDQAYELMQRFAAGELDPALAGAFLAGLRAKGETADEVRGFARAMRELAVHPAITWYLAYYVFNLDAQLAAIAVLQAALPTGVPVFILAQQYDVPPNQIADWKKRLVGGAETLFENGVHVDGDADEKVKDLHAKVGELTMERDFLSKALGRDR